MTLFMSLPHPVSLVPNPPVSINLYGAAERVLSSSPFYKYVSNLLYDAHYPLFGYVALSSTACLRDKVSLEIAHSSSTVIAELVLTTK